MKIIIPGRHQMLTKFQFESLKNLVINGIDGKKIDTIIFAVTSANHDNTRRNPLPLYIRTIMIDKFAEKLGCEVKIYPLNDIKYSDKFAEYILKQISYQWRDEITPEDTMLACSTPPIIKMFENMGFQNLPMELMKNGQEETYGALRPFEVVNLLVKDGKNWKEADASWRKYASPECQKIYEQYSLGDLIVELFEDSLLTDDADITDTRDYLTYAQGMDHVIELKFADINPFVVEGKVVDVGCATGSLMKRLAQEYSESDIIGIEASRTFYEYARSQEYASPLVFFYRRNITDQNFKENSVHTFIYSSVMHELYSYIGESTLLKALDDAHHQLTSGGRLIIRDVVGPENPVEEVYMLLKDDDGISEGDIKTLSTYAKFFRFVEDFKPRKIGYSLENIDGKTFIKTSIQNAYEYMSKMTYVDNWASEMHEEFGFYSFSTWKQKLKDIGFKIVAGSHEFSNPYIIEKKYMPRVELYSMQNGELKSVAYPATNMILVGEK